MPGIQFGVWQFFFEDKPDQFIMQDMQHKIPNIYPLTSWFGGKVMKKTGRPVLKIPRSPLEIVTEVLAVLGILVHALILVYYWPTLPDVIPTHFGLSGEVDGWGSKNTLLILLVVNAGMYVMMTVFNFFPHIFNYPVEITEKNARAQYSNARLMMNIIKVEIAYFFAYIEWGTVQVALGNASGLDGRIMIIALILISVSPFYFIWRMRGIG